VLLQHGVPKVVGNRVVYGLGGTGLIITVAIMLALLGIHLGARI
jgi:hypothetical protein